MQSLLMDGDMTPKLVGTVLASTGIEPLAALRSLRLWSALLTELSAVVRPYNSAIRAELLLCESLTEVLTSMVDNGTSPAEPVSPLPTASPVRSTIEFLVERIKQQQEVPLDQHQPSLPLTQRVKAVGIGFGSYLSKSSDPSEDGSVFTRSDLLLLAACFAVGLILGVMFVNGAVN